MRIDVHISGLVRDSFIQIIPLCWFKQQAQQIMRAEISLRFHEYFSAWGCEFAIFVHENISNEIVIAIDTQFRIILYAKSNFMDC